MSSTRSGTGRNGKGSHTNKSSRYRLFFSQKSGQCPGAARIVFFSIQPTITATWPAKRSRSSQGGEKIRTEKIGCARSELLFWFQEKAAFRFSTASMKAIAMIQRYSGG